MCTQVSAKDFQTVHHEMGHIQYYMQYRHQANLFRSGANAAFHEAIGDTVALSVATMRHLYAVQLSDIDPDTISRGNGPITIAIRARFEYDSATTRYNTLRGFRALASYSNRMLYRARIVLEPYASRSVL